MKKTLVALILALSSCVSSEKNCPDEKETLKAGLYLYSVVRPAISRNKRKEDIESAEYLVKDGVHTYFKCQDPTHKRKHSKEALEQAYKFLNVPEHEREKTNKFVETTTGSDILGDLNQVLN